MRTQRLAAGIGATAKHLTVTELRYGFQLRRARAHLRQVNKRDTALGRHGHVRRRAKHAVRWRCRTVRHLLSHDSADSHSLTTVARSSAGMCAREGRSERARPR